MRKLIWLVAVSLAVVIGSTSVCHAQKVYYEYGGPLDGTEAVPLRDVVRSGPLDRVSRKEPVRKLRPAHPGVRSSAAGQVVRASAYSPTRQTLQRALQTSPRTTGRAISSATQRIREAIPSRAPASNFEGPLTTQRSFPREPTFAPRQEVAPRSGYSGALTEPRSVPRSFSAESEYVTQQREPAVYDGRGYIPQQRDPVGYDERQYAPQQYEPVEYEYAGPLTGASSYPVESDFIPRQEDPTRFGYRDGEAFSFNNKRLYNPLEGPRLDLQGASTLDLGEPGCDEWNNFCECKDLELGCACGGLKANPGHLGLPWLGSKDSCDQRVPLLQKRGGCKKCRGEAACESCGSCPTCGK